MSERRALIATLGWLAFAGYVVAMVRSPGVTLAVVAWAIVIALAAIILTSAAIITGLWVRGSWRER